MQTLEVNDKVKNIFPMFFRCNRRCRMISSEIKPRPDRGNQEDADDPRGISDSHGNTHDGNMIGAMCSSIVKLVLPEV